ncbi:MAG: hypothetical protein IPI58_09445 [Alphaproteobacteria bacterium]|nr:MAG: hypothetical protein IPI58_09445 [Alphaproteobacteria bacterium]
MKFLDASPNIDSIIPDIARFGGKVANLLFLNQIPGIEVPDFIGLEIKQDPQDQPFQERLKQLLETVGPDSTFAVRSSGLREDGALSHAGYFITTLYVPGNPDDILNNIEIVRSHGQAKLGLLSDKADNEGIGVGVQRMIEHPDISGVAFSRDLDRAGPYVRINYTKGDGEQIVSGKHGGQSVHVLRDESYRQGLAPIALPEGDERGFLPQLMRQIYLIEDAYGHPGMDIEFAIKDGKIYILQARPLTTQPGHALAPDQYQSFHALFRETAESVTKLTADGDVLGNMIDINPRELLGDMPSKLDLSIYDLMFSAQTVPSIRKEMGYAGCESGLMRSISGRPYISLFGSAQSLMPGTLDPQDTALILEEYARQLRLDPGMQDCVEFEIYASNAEDIKRLNGIPMRRRHVIEAAFDDQAKNLSERARHVVNAHPDRIQGYRQRLAQFRDERINKDEGGAEDSLSLLNDAKELLLEGTGYFTLVARLAFSERAKYEKKYGGNALEGALESLETVSMRMQRDLGGYGKGQISRKSIIEEYGHLRPGQFHVFAPCYADDPDSYLHLRHYASAPDVQTSHLESVPEKRHGHFDQFLDLCDEGKRDDTLRLRALMLMREDVKFEFTRAFDFLAKAIRGHIKAVGLTEHQARHMEIGDIEGMMVPDVDSIGTSVNISEQSHHTAAHLMLPDVIRGVEDLYFVPSNAKNGYFYGHEKVKAGFIVLSRESIGRIQPADIEGKIVVLEQADPGYDFIFTMNPAGLVTQYGGPASHMAIRACESRLPACIGCGMAPNEFNTGLSLILDCQQKKIGPGSPLDLPSSHRPASVKGNAIDRHLHATRPVAAPL